MTAPAKQPTADLANVPLVDDFSAWCRQQTADQQARDAKLLDFSPRLPKIPKLWKPDDDRLIALFTSITPEIAALTYEQLRKLTGGKRKADPIWISVNSAGGHAASGIAMYSMIQEVVRRGVQVSVAVYGHGNSAASLIVQAASEGCRFAMEDAWMLIHAPKWVGDEPPTKEERRHVRQFRRRMCEIYAARTGKSVDRMMRDTRRDLYLHALEAKKYGLIDQVDGIINEGGVSPW